MAKRNIISVDVELTDDQILKSASEIYLEDPTAFLMKLTTMATAEDLADGLGGGLDHL